MNILKNILIVQKTSKLKFLIDKYGLDSCKNSAEYLMCKESMDIHINNCEKFVNYLQRVMPFDVKVKIINDNFLHNEILSDALSNSNFDLIFSLGGDGTFLRSANFINNNKQILVGVNTDQKNSLGFYCPMHIADCTEKNEDNLKRILDHKFQVRHLNKIEIEIKNKKHYFMNDLYFGEKFMGRISKYKLEVNNNKENEVLKSSGIIFSTYAGYSGWIRNANTISFTKFSNLTQQMSEKLSKSFIDSTEVIKMYNEKLYIPDYDDENSIFYFVREPSLRRFKENIKVEDYTKYLNKMEGSAKTINLENYCFEGILILDGSFTIPIDYNEKIKIEIGDMTIKTLYKL